MLVGISTHVFKQNPYKSRATTRFRGLIPSALWILILSSEATPFWWFNHHFDELPNFLLENSTIFGRNPQVSHHFSAPPWVPLPLAAAESAAA